jgi:hypothetical protein
MSRVLDKPSEVGHTSDTWDQEKADLGFRVVSPMRNHGNYSLGILLTLVETALGDTTQAKALKQQIRREMYALMDRNQAEVYEGLGIQKPGLAPQEIHIEATEE